MTTIIVSSGEILKQAASLQAVCEPSTWQLVIGFERKADGSYDLTKPIYQSAPYTPDPLRCSGGDPAQCQEPKLPDMNIPTLQDVFLQGAVDQITVTWNTVTSYPDQIVRFLYRPYSQDGETNVNYETSVVTRDSGTVATAADLEENTFYDIWLRPETPTHFGYWQKFIGLTSPLWNTDTDIVMHNASFVVAWNPDAVPPANEPLLYTQP